MTTLEGFEVGRKPGRFSAAVAEFVRDSPWLGPEHKPALVALEEIAMQLDNSKFTPALIAQFGLFHRQLASSNPDAGVADDPVADIISRGRAES